MNNHEKAVRLEKVAEKVCTNLSYDREKIVDSIERHLEKSDDATDVMAYIESVHAVDKVTYGFMHDAIHQEMVQIELDELKESGVPDERR